MARLRSYHHSSQGFTLIELIISAVVVGIIAVAVGQLFAANLLSFALGKSRATGLALATEKMEYLRDLPYDSLATQSGAIVPAGTILDNETLTRNGVRFKVNTVINYVDDPFDNTINTPSPNTDIYPYDYKQAEITVYTVNGNMKVARLTTSIGSKAAETASNTGILRIKVQDANGQPIEDAEIRITNPSVTPAINILTNTDSAGQVVVPKLPPDTNRRYQIVATKSGYSTEQTYADPAGAQTPVKPNPNVQVQQITDVTMSIDRTANLSVTVVDTAGNPIPGVSVTATSAKKTMTTPNVFKYTQAQTTNASGVASWTGIEWDSYTLTAPAAYRIITTIPYQAVPVDPASSTTATVMLSTITTWPQIISASPKADNAVGTTTLTITGASLTGSTIKLVKAGSPDINGTSVSINGGGTTLTATFNVNGVTQGSWNIVITKSGQVATQTGGFSVTAP
jgi:prepilin-type N-terminal cleavage/methylation domain-containing protein